MKKSVDFSPTFAFLKRYSYIEGQKFPRPPFFCTLITEYPNHRLHTTDLAATQGAFRQVRPGFDAMRLPNRSGAPPEAGEVAWNTYLKRRVSNHRAFKTVFTLLQASFFVTRKRFSACWGNFLIPIERCLRHRTAHPF